MDGFAISVASKVAEYLVGPIVRPFRYIWNYSSNLENLENEVKKLEGRREMVQHLVVDATRQGDEIFEHIQNWLDSANQVIDEASVVIEDNKQANTKCCKGLCPNPKKRFQLSKQAAKKAEAVAGVHEVGKFGQVVSYRTIPEETWLPSIKGYEAFDSRIPTLNKVLDALSDPDVNMVGVYGMGGIGKTTLAKEVARQAKEGTLFKVDEMVFVEVSEKPDIEKIQGVIADKLGLVFMEQSESGRARKLCERLKKEKNILIVLDNIWRGIDLETVGIPYGDNHKGCKLLLKARSRDVLSNQMGSQKTFSIDILNAEDAWSLFKKTVGACIEQLELQSVAVDVANACGGMPIAIVTTAKALRNRRVCEWNNALRQLTSPSPENFEGVAAEAYRSIQLSYDHLGVELKSTFLLCSTMEHTCDSPIEYLLRYGLGLGLYRNVNTMEEARDLVDTLVEKLRDSSLLLDTPDNQRFSMHDVVRDVARSIAFRDHHAFIVTNGIVPRYWTDKNILKNCTEIFLHHITEIPEGLDCPQLKIFYMKTNDRSSKIPDRFFTGMPELRVLHLIEMDLSSLPTSFSLLANLRTLCFDKCELGDIAIIGELKKLEILSFFKCRIEQLHKEMDQLSRLRLFDLSSCYNLKVFPPNVISSLTQLEELYLGSSFSQWEVYDEQVLDTRSINASLNELKQLSHLTALEIHVPDAEILSIGLFSEKLERYRICIGDNWHKFEWRKHYETSKTLKLKLNTNICLEDGVIAQLKGIRDLYLDEMPGFKNVYELHNKGFPELKHLTVQNNPNFLSIADSVQLVSPDAFPLLESLFLCNLVNLEKIHNGQLSAQSFHQLKTIEVQNCDKLKNIFSFSVARGLPQLQEVKVIKCENMEEIFVTERDVNHGEVSDNIQLNQLRYVALRCLPELISFCSKVKTPSSSQRGQKLLIMDHHELDNPPLFFNEKVLFPNLEALELYAINSEKIWHQQHPTMSSGFNNLKRLIVNECLNLKCLFSSSIVRNFVQLQHLELCKCATLEEVIVKEESRSDGEGKNIKFPQLAYLKMECLDNLKRFNSGNYIEFPSLKQMEIRECPEMKAFIFNDEVAFPSLEEVVFYRMNNLKMIWHSKLDKDSFMNLKSLEIEYCQQLMTVFPSYMCERLRRLETLKVERCYSLEEIFDLQGINIIEEAHSMTATQLRLLNLRELPNLKHVWNLDPKGMFSFQNLYKVEVSYCRAMKNLFPASFSRSDLLQLELIYVSNSGVEEIVAAKEEGAEAETTFVFPRMTYLSLYNLHDLRCFYQGVHNAKWPVLEYLEVYGCDKIEILLASEFPCLQENSQQGNSDLITTQQPLFLVQQGFPNLNRLKISGKAMTTIRHGQFLENVFHKLNLLEVYLDESTALPLGPLQRFQNLKDLTLSHCSYEEIFSYGEVDHKHMRALPQIECLVLYGLGDLKQDFKLDISLQNLTILKVWDCGRMVNLLTSLVAESLVQLKEMSIKDCNTMLEVVANDGDMTGDDEIIFGQLGKLTLECLSSLTSFCSGNFTIKFPSLEKLIVKKCPKMEIFSPGVLSTPRLREVLRKDAWGEESIWEGDLNTTIHQLAQNPTEDTDSCCIC